MAGDSDYDGDAHTEDFARFENCFGLDVTTYTQCAWADLDGGSTVVDLDDFAIFASCLGGQGENVAATGDYNDNGIVDVGDGEALETVCYSGPGNPPSSGCEILDLDGDDDVDADDRGILMYLLDTLAGPTVNVCITPFDSDQVNPYYFTGRPLDIVDGKQIAEHRARSYDVTNGRWMQRDPVEYAAGWNLYEYVAGCPLHWSDPHGLAAQDVPPSLFGDFPFWPPKPTTQPTTQPTAQPATQPEDKSKACCKYSEVTVTGGEGALAYYSRKYQKTESCSRGSSSPEDCCQCHKDSSFIGSTKLVSAHWGKCCSCVVTLRRCPTDYFGGKWPGHIAMIIDCPGGNKIFADHYQTPGPFVEEKPDQIKGRRKYYCTIVYAYRIDCDTGKRMIAAIKEWKGTLKYGLVQDCHWFCNKVRNVGRDGWEE